jgi:hypothetical protein
LPWLPWVSPDCFDYIGGCKPDDSRLQLSKWQQPLIDVCSIPIFQDRQWENAWDQFGGGQNDILIYDKQGRLFKYICSAETFSEGEVYFSFSFQYKFIISKSMIIVDELNIVLGPPKLILYLIIKMCIAYVAVIE